MNISVLTPDIAVFEGPIKSALAEGAVEIVKGSGEKLTFKIEKGFIEVLRDEVSLLVQGYQA